MAAATQKIIIHADDKTGAAVASAIRNTKKLDQQIKRTGDAMRTSTRQSRAHMAQLGHQVQDIAVQYQMGVNPLMILGQQGSQVASIFGTRGALFGGMLAIAAVIGQQFVPSLFAANKELKSTVRLARALDDLSALGPISDPIIAAQVADLREKNNELVDSFSEAQANVISYRDSINELRGNAELAAQVERDHGISIESLTQNMNAAEAEAQKLKDQYESNLAEIERLTASKEEASGATEKLARQTGALSRAMSILAPFIKRTTTPVETFNKQMKALETLFGAGEIELEKYLQMKELIHQQFVDNVEAGFKLSSSQEEINKKLKEGTEVAEEYGLTLQSVERNAVSSLEDGLVGLISGTKSASAAFKDMARSIISDLIRMQIQQSITAPLFGMINNGGLNIGTAMQYGTNIGSTQTSMIAAQNAGLRANGGPVSRNKPYIVGERGPELMIPRGGGTVIPNEDLSGRGAANVTVNVTTGVQQTVRAEIMNLLPQITNAAKAAVAQERQRGGSFSAAMGT